MSEDNSVKMQSGTVKWFNQSKGFGFITRVGTTDLFVHYSAISGTGYRILKEGQQVQFTEREGPQGTQAQDVVILAEPA